MIETCEVPVMRDRRAANRTRRASRRQEKLSNLGSPLKVPLSGGV